MADHDAAVRAGHISFEQAEGIAGRTGMAPLGGARVAEVLGYFGAVALAVATLVLAFDIGFGDLDITDILFSGFDNVPAGAIALLGAAILLFLGARFAAHPPGPIHRSGSFALLAGFGLASVAFGFLLWDLDLGDFTPLAKVIPVTAVALFVWLRSPSVPTQLALFGTATQIITAVLVLIQVQDQFDPAAALLSLGLGGAPDTGGWVPALVGVALGLAWIYLGMQGWIRTRNAAFAIGATYAWVESLQLFGSDDGWIVLSTLLAAGFAFGAARWQSSVLGGFATVAVIVLIGQFIAVLIDNPTTTTFVVAYGVPGALALIGAWMLSRPGGTPVARAMPMPPTAPVPAMAAAKAAGTTTAATKKPAAKKPAAAKKPTAKKPAATTAKKPAAAKKLAVKKPTAKKKTAR